MKTSILALTLAASLSLAPRAFAQFVTFEDATSLGIDDVAITPDGRYMITRDAGFSSRTVIVDLATGAVVLDHMVSVSPHGTVAPCVDAVEASNERAVSIGAMAVVIDLTQSPMAVIAEHDLGETPRDLTITPDGRYALVRGGYAPSGGVHVIELATGDLVLDQAADIQPFQLAGNDFCDADDFHGVALSSSLAADITHIHVVEFNASAGPAIVFETIGLPPLQGRPMDVDLSDDGQWAAVRSERELAILRLDGLNTSIVQRTTSFASPIGPYLEAVFDSVWMLGDTAITVSLNDQIPARGLIDMMSASGDRWKGRLPGVPHDSVVTPDRTKFISNTDLGLALVDLSALPVGGGFIPIVAQAPGVATATGLLAGVDSVACTDDRVVSFLPSPSGTRIEVHEIVAVPALGLQPTFGTDLAGRPIDVEIATDGGFAAWTTQEEYAVADLRTATLRIRENFPTGGGFSPFPGWPWSDGAALHALHAALGGIGGVNSNAGWSSAVDLMSREAIACSPNPNGLGLLGECFALGSTRVGASDLRLEALAVPPGQMGQFIYGDGFATTTLNGALLCVGGNAARFPVLMVGSDGGVGFDVDLGTATAPGAAFTAGSTWYFQFLHRDPMSAGGIGTTNALELLLQ